MKDGFIKVAAASPMIKVADTDYNADKVIECIKDAYSRGVKLIVFPELTLTGAGEAAYRQAHQNASVLLGRLVERIGLERADALTQQLNLVAADIQEIQDSQQKGTL